MYNMHLDGEGFADALAAEAYHELDSVAELERVGCAAATRAKVAAIRRTRPQRACLESLVAGHNASTGRGGVACMFVWAGRFLSHTGCPETPSNKSWAKPQTLCGSTWPK